MTLFVQFNHNLNVRSIKYKFFRINYIIPIERIQYPLQNSFNFVQNHEYGTQNNTIKFRTRNLNILFTFVKYSSIYQYAIILQCKICLLFNPSKKFVLYLSPLTTDILENH